VPLVSDAQFIDGVHAVVGGTRVEEFSATAPRGRAEQFALF
jgi:hypothetical protein